MFEPKRKNIVAVSNLNTGEDRMAQGKKNLLSRNFTVRHKTLRVFAFCGKWKLLRFSYCVWSLILRKIFTKKIGSAERQIVEKTFCARPG